MPDHYSLEVLGNEHQYELRRNADEYRLLQEGRTATPAQHLTLFRRIAGRLECLFAGWRYRMLTRRRTEVLAPLAEPSC